MKQKSRALANSDVKHSFHVIFNVCGAPGVHLQHVIRDCLKDSELELRKFKNRAEGASGSAFVDPETGEDRIFDHPEIGFDYAGIAGNTGVAMFGSRKSDRDPYCALTDLYTFSQGGVHVFSRGSGVVNPSGFEPAPLKGAHGYPEHDLHRLTRRQALDLMYQSSCSAPRDLMVAPLSAKAAEDEQNQTAIRPFTAPSKRGGPPAHGGPGAASQSARVVPLLPAWFREFLGKNPNGQGSDKPNWATAFKTHVEKLNLPGTDPSGWSVTRYGPEAGIPKSGCPCPHHFSDALNPCLHYHGSNGIILAVNSALPEIVFARCTDCRGCPPTNEDVQRVRTREGIPTNWISLSEEGFKTLMDKLEKKVQVKQRVEKITKGATKKMIEREQFMDKARAFKRQKK